MNKSIVNKLIKLSEIFKDGFTVDIKPDGSINQISHNTGYVISLKTIITIDTNNGNVKMSNMDNDITGIIGGWLDTDTGIYYIEKNTIKKNKAIAIRTGIEYNQKAIFDIKNNTVIEL